MGADYVINHYNPLKEELEKIGFKDGVDYIFNTVDTTAAYFDQFSAIVKPLGHIVGITGFSEPMKLGPLFIKRAQVSIEFMFSRPMFKNEMEK